MTTTSAYTVAEVIRSLPKNDIRYRGVSKLSTPAYCPITKRGTRLALGVESMKRHMTDEGYQLFSGLESAGYIFAGYRCPVDSTDVASLVHDYDPEVVVLQDKREWEGLTADRSMDPDMRFKSVTELARHSDIFKVTVLKDAQGNPPYHRQSAEEIGCHAWIVYYHPDIVTRLAPYVRRDHLVRTYHTIDKDLVPPYVAEGRNGCLLSGAISNAYPLRMKLVKKVGMLPQTTVMKHPGYHRNGSNTPEYLKSLTRYKVSICTSSRYGYALRKIMEATACGCRVLTDLPVDEVLPYIDGNLVRIHPRQSILSIAQTIRQMLDDYDPDVQEYYSNQAKGWYDYRNQGRLLAHNIDEMRRNYP